MENGVRFVIVVVFLVIVGFLQAHFGFIDLSALPASDPKETAATDGKNILKAAKKHDNEGYVWGGGHPPQSFKKGKGLDCSGLINVAVLGATGIAENQVASSFRDSSHWKTISFKKARAGDILYRLKSKHPGDISDHVVIVVSNKGSSNLTVFEAWTSHARHSEQIRETPKQHYTQFDGALRFHR